VAGGEGAEDGDDSEIPETATVDYVARRINRITARLRNTERQQAAREQQWSQERAHLQGQLEAQARLLQGGMPDTPQAPSGPPQPEQFQSHEDYVRAAARFEAQQVQQQSQQQSQQQAQMEAHQRDLMAREQAFRAQHRDFDERIRTGLAGKVAPHVQQALMVLPDGPALAYALATQPETLTRLNQLPPPLMLLELGRLLPATATPPVTTTPESAPPVSPTPQPPAQATPPATGTLPVPIPEPLRPVGGTATSAPAGFDPTTATQAEFRKQWAAGWRPRPDQFAR
jgi:hypothetical protein